MVLHFYFFNYFILINISSLIDCLCASYFKNCFNIFLKLTFLLRYCKSYSYENYHFKLTKTIHANTDSITKKMFLYIYFSTSKKIIYLFFSSSFINFIVHNVIFLSILMHPTANHTHKCIHFKRPSCSLLHHLLNYIWHTTYHKGTISLFLVF